MQRLRQREAANRGAGPRVDRRQRRLHRRQVQLGAAAVGMGQQPAVGDHQAAAVGAEPQVVRPDALAVQLAGSGVAALGLPYPAAAAAALVVTLGGLQRAPGPVANYQYVVVPAWGGPVLRRLGARRSGDSTQNQQTAK